MIWTTGVGILRQSGLKVALHITQRQSQVDRVANADVYSI